jgi:hypothetical protein
MTIPNEIRHAVKNLGIELRIMSALITYAEDAGADTEIESFQAYRVSEAFDEVHKLVGDPEYPDD